MPPVFINVLDCSVLMVPVPTRLTVPAIIPALAFMVIDELTTLSILVFVVDSSDEAISTPSMVSEFIEQTDEEIVVVPMAVMLQDAETVCAQKNCRMKHADHDNIVRIFFISLFQFRKFNRSVCARGDIGRGRSLCSLCINF